MRALIILICRVAGFANTAGYSSQVRALLFPAIRESPPTCYLRHGGAKYPYVPAAYSGGYTRTDPLASVGLVLGILGVIFFFSAPYGYLLSIPATAISAVAIYRTNRDPGLGGSGIAKAGLVLGIVGISLCTLFVIGCAAPKSVVRHGGWWRTIGGG